MKRVLVVCYSQTGQLRRCADAFVEPMRQSGEVQVDFVSPQPQTPFPFPWGFSPFVHTFPDCVLGLAPPMVEASLKAPAEKYDLVVLAYQVWYLSPALPVVGWLQSEAAAVLENTPVVALCACRNMWQRAIVDLKRLVSARGGRLIDHVVREDSGPAWATFWSTPRWMLTGDPVGWGVLPKAGVSDADIATLSGPGQRMLEALKAGRLSKSVLGGAEAPVHKVFVIPEMVARWFFGLWASAIVAGGRRHPFFRWVLERAFFFSLCASVPLMIPAAVVALFIRLSARSWFQRKLDEVAVDVEAGVPT